MLVIAVSRSLCFLKNQRISMTNIGISAAFVVKDLLLMYNIDVFFCPWLQAKPCNKEKV